MTLPIMFMALIAMSQTHNQLLVASILIYLLAFSIGFSSTIWAITQEIFPTHLSGTAVAIANAVNWLSNFTVASVFLTSKEANMTYTYMFLAGMTLVAQIFVYT